MKSVIAAVAVLLSSAATSSVGLVLVSASPVDGGTMTEMSMSPSSSKTYPPPVDRLEDCSMDISQVLDPSYIITQCPITQRFLTQEEIHGVVDDVDGGVGFKDPDGIDDPVDIFEGLDDHDDHVGTVQDPGVHHRHRGMGAGVDVDSGSSDVGSSDLVLPVPDSPDLDLPDFDPLDSEQHHFCLLDFEPFNLDNLWCAVDEFRDNTLNESSSPKKDENLRGDRMFRNCKNLGKHLPSWSFPSWKNALFFWFAVHYISFVCVAADIGRDRAKYIAYMPSVLHSYLKDCGFLLAFAAARVLSWVRRAVQYGTGLFVDARDSLNRLGLDIAVQLVPFRAYLNDNIGTPFINHIVTPFNDNIAIPFRAAAANFTQFIFNLLRECSDSVRAWFHRNISFPCQRFMSWMAVHLQRLVVDPMQRFGASIARLVERTVAFFGARIEPIINGFQTCLGYWTAFYNHCSDFCAPILNFCHQWAMAFVAAGRDFGYRVLYPLCGVCVVIILWICGWPLIQWSLWITLIFLVVLCQLSVVLVKAVARMIMNDLFARYERCDPEATLRAEKHMLQVELRSVKEENRDAQSDQGAAGLFDPVPNEVHNGEQYEW